MDSFYYINKYLEIAVSASITTIAVGWRTVKLAAKSFLKGQLLISKCVCLVLHKENKVGN